MKINLYREEKKNCIVIEINFHREVFLRTKATKVDCIIASLNLRQNQNLYCLDYQDSTFFTIAAMVFPSAFPASF